MFEPDIILLVKNALILHGTDNNSQGNWFPWLKKQLEKHGWKVWIPDLPRSDKPSVKRYNKYILKDNDWEFNENSVIIGHSSGAVAILGLLQELPNKTVINKCILVAAFKNDLGWNSLEGLFDKPFDFQKIKSRAKHFIFIHSDNDPYCPLEHAEFLSNKLNGKLIIKKGQKHFNLEQDPKYKRFPFLLKILGLT